MNEARLCFRDSRSSGFSEGFKMRKLSLVASMLGCMSLLLLSPAPSWAGVVPSLSFDDITETPSAAVTNFSSFSATFDKSTGSEVISFGGAYASAPPTHLIAGEAFVVLLDPGTRAVSDILDITFVQTKGNHFVTINGTFTSDGDPGPTLVAPEGAPTLVETGDWQDVSSLVQQQLAEQGFTGGNITILLRSDVDSNVIPEPASMIVWSFIACCVGVPGLRRRWRAGRSVA
jgi:hypothetical protein